jgi:transcriptional regulator with GAF, ATPase, and Fis domain
VIDREEDMPFTGEYLDFAHASTDDLQTRIFELLTLVETSRELLRAHDADDVARRVLLSVIGVLGASSASVLRRDPIGERMELLVHAGLELEERLEFHLPSSMAEAFEQKSDGRPFRVDQDLVQGPARDFLHSYDKVLETLDAAVVCPLIGRQGLFGFLLLGRRLLSEGYSSNDLEVFASLAELYTLALERGAGPAPILGRASAEVPREVSLALHELRELYPPLRGILGESEVILQLFRDMVQLAPSRATVLIQGESGTGKEVVARAIHELSARQGGPLEIVDCSSIPRELIESELFGHVRGAFTGAVRDRRGAFELAHRGTLFLDEIGDMSLASQTRLLRALQEGRFRPVGGEKTRSVDVRVIAATNVDLREAVARGEFRKDLFYRVQVYPLRLPPLRERVGDIAILSRAFLKRFYADFGLTEPTVDPEVIAALQAHLFPGNVRELQNMVEALAIRSRDERHVRLEHLRRVFASQQLTQRPLTAAQSEEGSPHLLRTDTEGGEKPPAPSGSRTESQEEPSSTRSGIDDAAARQILRAWRQNGFNLLEASRRLKSLRAQGEDVAIVDRVQMNHYLDGETLKAFVACGSAVEVVDLLTAGSQPRHRVARRTTRLLHQALKAMEDDSLKETFQRLPAQYEPVLKELQNKGVEWVRKHLEAGS